MPHLLFANELFLRKMLVSFLSSSIPLHIKKNPMEKLCKVLEMELKMYTPVGPKFVFKKIKFKVLHYNQHDSFTNAKGSVKIILSCLKVLLSINCFDRRLWNTFKNLLWWSHKRQQILLFDKRQQIFTFIKVGAANVLLKFTNL